MVSNPAALGLPPETYECPRAHLGSSRGPGALEGGARVAHFSPAKLEPLKPLKRYLAFAGAAPAPREDACSTRQAGPLVCSSSDQGLLLSGQLTGLGDAANRHKCAISFVIPACRRPLVSAQKTTTAPRSGVTFPRWVRGYRLEVLLSLASWHAPAEPLEPKKRKHLICALGEPRDAYD